MKSFLYRFKGRVEPSRGWIAKCPAHADMSHSLSIREGDGGRVLVHCFAGCPVREICTALGISLADLFTDHKAPRSHATASWPMEWRKAPGDTAFLFQLHALDLRLRAERVLSCATGLHDTAAWSDADRDKAMSMIATVHDDLRWADVLDDLATGLRHQKLTEERVAYAYRRSAA